MILDLEEHYYSNLRRYSTLPATWPLARLMFPIRDLRKQMETLLQTYCFETAVTCAEAKEQSAYVRRMALHLGQYLAIYLTHGQDGKWRVSQGSSLKELTPNAGACGIQTR